MKIKAYAKVNLVLDCLYRRDDGYHELAGIMHSIDLFDEVSIMPASSGISVKCSENIPEDNTAYRAAELYFKAARISHGAEIFIEKHIPSQAGLGGASADAAAVLSGLNSIYNALDEDSLSEAGRNVGADVPFCLLGGCAYAGGIGEKLKKLPAQHLYLVLVKGESGISTKELFAHHDEMYGAKQADIRLKDAVSACTDGNTEKLCRSAFNTLENAAFDVLPELSSAKSRILSTDALCALMTGSGSCVYGIYSNREHAKAAEKKLMGYGYPFVRCVKTI